MIVPQDMALEAQLIVFLKEEVVVVLDVAVQEVTLAAEAIQVAEVHLVDVAAQEEIVVVVQVMDVVLVEAKADIAVIEAVMLAELNFL